MPLRRRATVDGLDARPSGEGVTWKPPSVTGLVRLLQGNPGGGEGPDAAFVERLRAQVPDLDRAAALARRLGQMLRWGSEEKLADWLAEASTSLLRRFAEGLQRDREGIENAMTTSWTTSPVEGQISRLKLIKRH